MKIGDIVYSEIFGKGKIICINRDTLYYGVEFKNYNRDLYNLNGRCDDGHGYWCTDDKNHKRPEQIITPYKFTKQDLKVGDKLTTRGGAELIFCGNYFAKIGCKVMRVLDYYDDNLKLTNSFYSIDDIVKVERPTYDTIFEREEEILDEKEKEYLSAVIRPFKDDIRYISKFNSINDNEYICIALNREGIILPDFKKGTMYKGMELEEKYTLKELGLDE